MSVRIKSFLRKADGNFVPVQSWKGPIGDTDYLEGALELNVNGTPLITTAMWDYIDQLWAYILNSLNELASDNSSHAYFPDQPIKLEMKRIARGVLHVSIGSRSGKFNNSTRVQEGEFVQNLIDAGEGFFLQMQELDPESGSQYEIEIERIAALRSAYSTRDC
ncbi:hypothetical protein [Nocardiopsis alborubida]|uniref:Uncharacterized protein n=1 Tax=Nocardiopsis alborubida TaxID=146802 RepID=A0A7X6RTA2_9ACTN|nr:hypothetical protein [Nocardiopsis alborubida]NKZ01052.1 hypothetical protein [Nocardiopsis alborubida]